jgi:hypothetical protein
VIDRSRWLEIQETLVRALKGEDVRIPAVDPGYGCSNCQDTAFVVEVAFDGTRRSRRCPRCRPRVDAEIKQNRKFAVADVPDDEPAPAPRDWKKLTGLDEED